MTAYSIDGYLAAIQMRSRRTLLLEGSSDSVVIHRLVIGLERQAKRSLALVLDSAEMLRSDSVPGNRQRVEDVHARLGGHWAEKVAFLVDREYREFDVATDQLTDQRDDHAVIENNLFWTRGHSIENYLVGASSIAEVLDAMCAECATPEGVDALRTPVDAAVVAACNMALACRDCAVLSRARGLIQVEHWRPEGGTIVFAVEEFVNALAHRGVSESERAEALALFEQYRVAAREPVAVDRWLAHGAFAWEFVWVAVGALLLEEELCKRHRGFFEGHWDDKLRLAADRWVQRVLGDAEEIAPRELMAWICAA